MKKAIKIIVLVLFLLFIGIQFIRPDFTNPPVIQSETLETSTDVPENVREILTRSCKDCHSNETNYPWYSKIQPSASFLSGHIAEGRNELNFSVWNTYETRRKIRKLDEICEMVGEKQMPLPSYLWIHWNSKLSENDINILCDWTKAEQQRLESSETK